MEDQMEERQSEGRRGFPGFFAGLLLGGSLGAAIALLKAAQSGEETRAQIRWKALEVRDTAEQTVTDARSRVAEVGDQVARRSAELQARGKAALDEGEKHLSKAVDETKQAAKALADV